MTEREQLVKEAEELAAWLESIESWQISDKAFQTHSKQALTVRRLLSLLPKEGEVVVPVEPTDEMIHACMKTGGEPYIGPGFRVVKELYYAMIESRPK